MRHRHTIDVELEPDEALELVAISFTTAPVLTVPRWWDRGQWQIDRIEQLEQGSNRGLCITPGTKWMLFEPPVDDAQWIPEPLAILISATALEGGGARVEARLTRRSQVLAGIAVATIAQLFESLGLAPLGLGIIMIANHRKRRAAKTRMLRLAIEPLLPHQRGTARGPFRRG